MRRRTIIVVLLVTFVAGAAAGWLARDAVAAQDARQRAIDRAVQIERARLQEAAERALAAPRGR